MLQLGKTHRYHRIGDGAALLPGVGCWGYPMRGFQGLTVVLKAAWNVASRKSNLRPPFVFFWMWNMWNRCLIEEVHGTSWCHIVSWGYFVYCIWFFLMLCLVLYTSCSILLKMFSCLGWVPPSLRHTGTCIPSTICIFTYEYTMFVCIYVSLISVSLLSEFLLIRQTSWLLGIFCNAWFCHRRWGEVKMPGTLRNRWCTALRSDLYICPWHNTNWCRFISLYLMLSTKNLEFGLWLRLVMYYLWIFQAYPK